MVFVVHVTEPVLEADVTGATVLILAAVVAVTEHPFVGFTTSKV